MMSQQQPTVQKIHPELNLEKWSIWKPSKSPHKTLTSRVLIRERGLSDGSTLRSTVQIGFTEYGSLTTEDRKTYYGLVKIWEEKGCPPGLVPLSLRHLASVLKKKWGTNVIQSLTQSLLRLRLTPLKWEDSYYNAETRETEQLLTAFTILAELHIMKRKKDGHLTKEGGYFQFNHYILRNLLNRHTKPFYLSTLLTFQTDIAQLLYTYLDLIMADKIHYERKSAGLFKDLGLNAPAYRKSSNRKQKLSKTLQELQGVRLSSGVLIEAKLVLTSDRKDYKVVFRKSSEYKQRSEQMTQQAEHRSAETQRLDAAGQLVSAFHARLQRPDYKPSRKEYDQAAGLVEKYGPEPVRFLIEYAVKEARKTHFQMQTFGAIFQYEQEGIAIYTHHIRKQQQAQQLELALTKHLSQHMLQQQFDMLEPAIQQQIQTAAEAKLASHKDRMKADVYQSTLELVILQEMHALFMNMS